VRRHAETICPAELLLAPPPKPALPADATLVGDEYGLGYAAARFSREDDLEQRLRDAAAACPAPAADP
jgi:hypothetical protein